MKNKNFVFYPHSTKILFSIFLMLFVAGNFLFTGEIKEEKAPSFIEEVDVAEGVLDEGEGLSLEEATRIGLADNLDIKIIRLSREIEQHELPIAKSIYDTELDIFADYSQDKDEQTIVDLGSRKVVGKVGTSLSKEIPLGTDIKFEVATERNSASSKASKNYQSYAEISVTQPLLKNFFGLVDRNQIKQVKINTKKFDYETLNSIETSIAQVRNQYWDLVFANEDLIARQKALDKAQEFMRITHENHELGLNEKPDLYATQANVRKKYVEALKAKNKLYKASYALKVLLNVPEIKLIIPENKPKLFAVKDSFDSAVAKALDKRWDLKQMDLTLENQMIEVKIKKNEALPDLSFTGSYTATSLDREMASSQGEVFGFRHPQYEAGITFSTPLERRKERHTLKEARLELERLKKEKEKLKLTISKEIDAAWRDMQLASKEVVQNREVEELERLKLEEEEKFFNRGKSDSKTIIDFQDDLINAEIEHIRALVGYVKSVESFYKYQNSLMEYAGLEKVVE